jgi:CubicO group peptidase (beta-lactamase class C family)
MLHNVKRRGPMVFIRVLIAVLVLLAIGLFLSAREASAQSAPASDAWKAQLDSTILAEMARTATPGVQIAVAYRGEIIYAKAYGVADVETSRPLTNATLFRIGSVTKMFTGAAAAELMEQGKLDARAPISQYVPSLAGKRVGTVTMQQLLTHTAGWRDNAVAYGRMGEGALGEVMTEVSDTMFITEPGRVISYSNPGFSMAGYVMERAAGERYGTVVERMILRPMGMQRASFRPLEVMTTDFSQGHQGPAGQPSRMVRPFTENTAQWAAGFLFASASDVAKFAITLMDGGTIGGTRVLSENAVKRVTTGDPVMPGDSTARYGYGILVGVQDGRRVWQHGGSINGFDATVTMFPDERLAIAITDNRSGPSVSGTTRIIAAGVAGIVPPAPPAEPPERVANATERAQLIGHYAAGPTRLEIAQQGDTLVFRQNGGSFGVRLMGTDRLKVLLPGTLSPVFLTLVRESTGRVAYLHQSLRAVPRVEAPR